jgi:hypothetical protein
LGEARHIFHNSVSGTWSIMDSGLVYEACGDLMNVSGVPFVFDCSTKKLFDLIIRVPEMD